MAAEEKIVEKKWYVLRAISGKENKVKEHIIKESQILKVGVRPLSEYVSQVLVPTEKVYQVRNKKKISKERCAFPGYVLVEAELINEVQFILSNVPDVIGFLSTANNGIPTPIRKSEVDKLLGIEDEKSNQDEELLDTFAVGEAVKVVDGPFNNFSGVIEEVNLDKKKLKVSVKIFGRKTPVELSFMQVIKE